jgi:hypothetical protein
MWLDGFDVRSGQLQGVSLGPDGGCERVDLREAWALGLPLARSSRLKANVRLDQGTRVCTSLYTREMGFDVQVSERHHVYSFEASGWTVLLPALVLMNALFRPAAQIVPFVLQPHGFDMFCAPTLHENTVGVHIIPRTMRIYANRHASFRNLLAWFYCFPTARRLWSGVYSSARRGDVALALPEAEASLYLIGRRRKGVFYATSATLRSIDARELPWPWASAQSRHFEVMKMDNHRATDIMRDARLLRREGEWSLSDEEWAEIRKQFFRRYSKPLVIRSFLDCILEKLGEAKRWEDATAAFPHPLKIANFFRLLRQNGKWEKLVSLLVERRSTVVVAERLPIAGDLRPTDDGRKRFGGRRIALAEVLGAG